MPDLPFDIADSEKILRAIMTPFHIKVGKNELRPAAFRSPPGKDEVSVMRHDFMRTPACRAKAKAIGGAAYIGLAVIGAEQIRNCGSTVKDSREEFLGHADISHGYIVEKDEPQTSDINMRITERCRALIKAAIYSPDPDPAASHWTGPAL